MGLESVVNNLIKVGKVESYNQERATCRVIFEENDHKSFDLPILVKQSLKNKDYWIPDKDEMVLCLFLPTGIETGFILGAIYNKEDTTPISNPNIRHISFEDGTVIEYDRESHKLTIDVKGTVEIKSTGAINISSDTSIALNAPRIDLN